jgi:hypothetical protein
MQKSLGALSGLDQEEQQRVLNWLMNKLNLNDSNTSRITTDRSSTPSGLPSAKPAMAMSPKNFLVEKRPTTDVERVTCLAYFLARHRDMAQFKTKQLTDLNKEAAQPKFSNAAVAVQNATVQNQFLSQAGVGNKQITARGEAFVEALPDRDRAKVALQSIPLRGYRKAKKSGTGTGKGSGARKA